VVHIRRVIYFVLVDQPDHLGLYGMSFVYTVRMDSCLPGFCCWSARHVLVITYAMLVSVMPRTGGDYAWQSRVLARAGACCRSPGGGQPCFLWAPIYANILVVQFFSPLAYTLGWTGVAPFSPASRLFVCCLLVLASEHRGHVAWRLTRESRDLLLDRPWDSPSSAAAPRLQPE